MAGLLTAGRLKELVRYEPATGNFYWVSRASKNTHIGSLAGSANLNDYWTIRLDGKLYYAHRLAVLYMTGSFPINLVDHRDTCKSNNAWVNLRDATHAQNEWNTSIRKTNTSEIKGVSWIARLGKWRATIRINGRSKHLGCFGSIELATEFRQLAADMLHGSFARHA